MADAILKYQSEIDVLIDKGAKLPLLSVPENKYAYRYVLVREVLIIISLFIYKVPNG
jgi:hypothetical protein